jgi:hypothetical protein
VREAARGDANLPPVMREALRALHDRRDLRALRASGACTIGAVVPPRGRSGYSSPVRHWDRGGGSMGSGV